MFSKRVKPLLWQNKETVPFILEKKGARHGFLRYMRNNGRGRPPDVPRKTIEKRREQAFKCRKRHVSPLRGSVPLPYGRETLHIGRGDSRIARPVGGDMPCEHGAIYAVRAIYPLGADAICCKFCEFATRGAAGEYGIALRCDNPNYLLNRTKGGGGYCANLQKIE